MIRFKCGKCGQGFKVSDQHAGKQTKCPKCNSTVVVPSPAAQTKPPEQPEIIKFHCPSCNQKIGLAKQYAGKTVRCAKCKNPLQVPGTPRPAAPPKPPKPKHETEVLRAGQEEALSTEGLWGDMSDMEPLRLAEESAPSVEMPSEQDNKDDEYKFSFAEPPTIPVEPAVITDTSEETEPTSKRSLPWPIDIFLYPASIPGIATVGVITAGNLLSPLFCCASWLIDIVFMLYTYWFFCECVRDSAAGGLRAPEIIGSMESLGEMFWQFLRLFACYCFFFGPVTFYFGYSFFTSIEPSTARINSIILFSLLTYGIFFFPIGILAVIMFDSVRGLNPVLLVRSIASAFFQYCGLVILFYGLYFLFYFFIAGSAIMSMATGSIIWGMLLNAILSRIIFLWMLFVAAHLLGRFYWRYEDRLYWEV